MAILVAVQGWDPTPWVERLQSRMPVRDIRAWPDDMGKAEEIDYLLAWKAPGDLLRSLGSLKIIFSLGAGVDHLFGESDIPAVPIVRVVDPDLTKRMTEWTVLQVLLHHRQHFAYAAQQKQALWRELPQPAASDVRVGVLGLGVLGAATATALANLDFNVAGWARSRKTIAGIQSFAGDEELDGFLERTDILVNLLPLTQETRHFIDHALLSKLARDGRLGGPIFINAGRGASQVENDLYSALTDGTLKAASLDVFEREPLDATSPFWALDNASITPHVAADSDPEALSAYVVSQIEAFEAGNPLQNIIDRNAGY